MRQRKTYAAICSLVILANLLLGAVSLAGPRFTDNGDGTITDHQLGLMWARSDNNGDIDWEQAQAWALENFNDTLNNKYKNWRLPTIEELQSLFIVKTAYKGYSTDCGFVVRIAPEIKLSCILVWSSDMVLGSHLAYNFNMGDSFTIPSYDINGCRALPVRSLK